MKLFHWNTSEALRQYARGNIIVMAETVDEARDIAKAEFEKFCRDESGPMGWKFYDESFWDEYDKEVHETFMQKFYDDIAKDPIDNKVAIFIMGSS